MATSRFGAVTYVDWNAYTINENGRDLTAGEVSERLADLARHKAALAKCVEAMESKEFDCDIGYDCIHVCSVCKYVDEDGSDHEPGCPYAAALTEAKELLNDRS